MKYTKQLEMDEQKRSKVLSDIKGPEENADQEITEKPTKKENTRKRKRTQSLEVLICVA